MQMELPTEYQTALSGAVLPGSTVFAQPCLSENLGSLKYLIFEEFKQFLDRHF